MSTVVPQGGRGMGKVDLPFIEDEDRRFFFAAMTWDADMMEVMLSRAPNPLRARWHSAAKAAHIAAAFPLPGEELPAVTSRSRPSFNRRRNSRKTRRSRMVQLLIPYDYACDKELPNCEDWGDYIEGGEFYDSDGALPPTDQNPETDGCVCAEDDAWDCGGEHTVVDVDAKFPEASMRDFLRIFFQSVFVIFLAQLQFQHCSSGAEWQLSALERKALHTVHCYKDQFKIIVRKYVMSGDKEVERHGAQPLFVDGFSRLEQLNGESERWVPLHEQLFISGKDPVYQPLLLEALGIARVVQCYAEPGMNCGAASHAKPSANAQLNVMKSDRMLNTMFSWKRLLLDRSPSAFGEDASFGERFDALRFSDNEWEEFQSKVVRCFSPLQWVPYTMFGPYAVLVTSLPYTNRRVTKLVIPAEDSEAYDLSVHFQEGVFRFIHGTPLFPIDFPPTRKSVAEGQQKPDVRQGSCLLHCAAGMHRSSALAIAYLLWLVALSCGKLPTREGTVINSAGDGSDRGKRNEKKKPGDTYLTVALRSRQCRRDFADDVESSSTSLPSLDDSASVAAASERNTEAQSQEVAATKTLEGEKEKSTLQCCADHVRLQRSMAVPISSAVKQLQYYAHLLRLM